MSTLPRWLIVAGEFDSVILVAVGDRRKMDGAEVSPAGFEIDDELENANLGRKSKDKNVAIKNEAPL